MSLELMCTQDFDHGCFGEYVGGLDNRRKKKSWAERKGKERNDLLV